jgi:hypothetical protein
MIISSHQSNLKKYSSHLTVREKGLAVLEKAG